MDSNHHHPEEIICDLRPLIIIYKDGHTEKPMETPPVPPSPLDPITNVSSKDTLISPLTGLSTRIFLPKIPKNHSQKLPILVYFHGGAFCFESVTTALHQRYLNTLASCTKTLLVGINFRNAPHPPLPTAYNDCWEALKWVANHSKPENRITDPEEWLTRYGDFDQVFLGGDSSGGNIVHNIAMRAGNEALPNGVQIEGAFMGNPFFWGKKRVGSEPEADPWAVSVLDRVWSYVCGGSGLAPENNDDPCLNPLGPGAPSLAGLGCYRMLVYAGGLDILRDRARAYYDGVRESGWRGEVEWYEEVGEDHGFNVFNPDSDAAKRALDRLGSFIGFKMGGL